MDLVAVVQVVLVVAVEGYSTPNDNFGADGGAGAGGGLIGGEQDNGTPGTIWTGTAGGGGGGGQQHLQ